MNAGTTNTFRSAENNPVTTESTVSAYKHGTYISFGEIADITQTNANKIGKKTVFCSFIKNESTPDRSRILSKTVISEPSATRPDLLLPNSIFKTKMDILRTIISFLSTKINSKTSQIQRFLQ